MERKVATLVAAPWSKRTFVRTMLVVCLASFIVGMVATAGAEDDSRCSNATASGKWGFTTSGTVFLPPTGVAVPAVIVGRFTLDASGNLVGTQTRSLNGAMNDETFSGTITVNPDCTATFAVSVFHSGVLNRTATSDLVFLNSLREYRGVFTSAISEPSGTSIATVLEMDGKKIVLGEIGQ